MAIQRIVRRWLPLVLPLLALPLYAQEALQGPASEKAQKSYKEGQDQLRHGQTLFALDSFKKADKQDGGHCQTCQQQIVRLGMQTGDWKAAERAAADLIAEATDKREQAIAHYNFGMVLMNEGFARRKDELFSRAHDEMTQALAVYSMFPSAYFQDGKALARMKQDDAAKVQFAKFVAMAKNDDVNRVRAQRFIGDPELARARMAPAFEVTTLDGQHVSLDGLQGKVVLLDFWATWCGPCRAALPHMRDLAKKFQGQPFVILSVSLDNDDEAWKAFVSKNEMTWLQYRDGGFKGPVASLFGVEAIPNTFTIDTDGVLQDEHIGDASLEGKIKKLIAHAEELQATAKSEH